MHVALRGAQARSGGTFGVGDACLSATAKMKPSGTMRKTGKIGYKVKPEGDNTQELNTKRGNPTKYKAIEPTLIEDLEQHQPTKYKAPSERELDHLDEGDFIKIAFINREDIWLVVERVDPNMDSLIYAKVAQPVKLANELQQNQRVTVRREHVVGIRFNDEEVY